MSDKNRRKELREQYDQTPPGAGIYRIVNTLTGKALIGSTPNLRSAESKLEFAKSTKTTGVMFQKMKEDIEAIGIDRFDFEILEVLETKADTPIAQIRADLKVMETLWREQADPALLY